MLKSAIKPVSYSRIIGTGGYLPTKTLNNCQLEQMVATSSEWILERTGIKNRHIAAADETTVMMAEAAARQALASAQLNPEQLQLIIVATVTPHQNFPNTASLLHHQLAVNNTACAAFDVSVACSGFIYALSIADQYIRSGQVQYALVVGADCLTKFVDWQDRATCILFSDGAGAVILAAQQEAGIYSTHLHTAGNYHQLLYNAGSNYDGATDRTIKMQGNKLFKIAVAQLDAMVEEVLQHNQLSKQAIDWLVPHQANLRIITATAKKLELPMERVLLTIAEQGNTSAASVPLALNMGIRDGRIKKNDLLLLEAFGAGLAWGAALVRY